MHTVTQLIEQQIKNAEVIKGKIEKSIEIVNQYEESMKETANKYDSLIEDYKKLSARLDAQIKEQKERHRKFIERWG